MDTDDASRSAFEAWFCYPLAAHLRRAGDSYVLMSARTAWRAWRAGVAVEREKCIEAVEGNFDGSSYGLPPRISALIVDRINQCASTTGPLPAELRASIDQSLPDCLDGLLPADHRAWTEDNGITPITQAMIASIDALVGDVVVDLEAPLDPRDE